jgi:hypothetical protein
MAERAPLSVLGHVLPGEMTPRARAYMVICAFRHLLIGIACFLAPQGFRSETYEGIKNLLPMPPDTAIAGWGGMFLAAGIFAAAAAWLGREGEARWALLASVLTTSLWAGGLTVYVVTLWCTTGDLINPTGPLVWTALCLKDVTMLRSPLRNPFEALVRQIGDEVEAKQTGR